MTATNEAEEEAPKKRGRRPKEAQEPGVSAFDASPDVSSDNDGPGIYECIKKCIGRKEWHVGDRAHFERNPGIHYFKKVKE